VLPDSVPGPFVYYLLSFLVQISVVNLPKFQTPGSRGTVWRWSTSCFHVIGEESWWYCCGLQIGATCRVMSLQSVLSSLERTEGMRFGICCLTPHADIRLHFRVDLAS
jgi:hypothetical protein